jgi:hypothetical protein
MSLISNAYIKFLNKVESNVTNDNISANKQTFIFNFNESQNRFIEFHLQQRGVDDIRYIQKFLILDKDLEKVGEVLDRSNFKLPINYLDIADVRAKAKQKNCEDFINLYEIQVENLNEILKDPFQRPSFKYREAPFLINNNEISIYVDDFKVSKVYLNYYRYPNQIRLLNPDNPESDFDETLTIEWDDKSLDRIISMAAGEHDMNTNNPRFQAQIVRTQK